MNLSKYHWNIVATSLEVDEQVAQLQEAGMTYSPAFLRLCVKRGLKTPADIQEATNQQPQLFHDPFELYEMDKAVERLRNAIENQELIMIYGDYDADGITSTLILYEALETLGANVRYYLPNRLIDGYGPNLERYRALIEEGVQLILTCDNGVAGHEAIEYAMNQGVDVIVSDHHELQATLPQAYAIIHPKHPKGRYPFTELSGAGVALKIATALLEEVPVEAIELAAIGTVSDMVSLTNENRTIVLSGLKLLTDTHRVGLQLMFESEKVDTSNLSTDTIGFIIGPRLNAIGRLGDPMPALELLRTFDHEEACELLELVNSKNVERKAIVEQIMADVTERLNSLPNIPEIIIEADEKWAAGVLGIVASRLVERYQRPVLLFQYQAEQQWYKGSGRSTSSIHLFDWLLSQKNHMLYFGGHSQAAGMTVNQTEWETFIQGMYANAKRFIPQDKQAEAIDIELILSPEEVSETLISEVALLGPFGMDNAKPLALIKDAVLEDIRFIGTEKQHVKALISKEESSLNLIGFSMAERFSSIQKGDCLSVVGELTLNEWQNHITPQIQLKDIGIEGTEWIDYRSSHIGTHFFQQENALYVFQNKQLAQHYENQLQTNCQTILYADKIPKQAYSVLVIVEPPSQIKDLTQLIHALDWQKIILGAYTTESKYLVGEPTREEFALIYRWLHTQPPFEVRQRLSMISQQFNLPISKLKIIFHVFFEAGFVKIEDGVVTVQKVETGHNINLFELPAMRKYRSAMEAEAVLIYQSLKEIKAFFNKK